MHEVRRLDGGRGAEVVEYELVRLLEPQVGAAERVVVEGPDAEHAHAVVVDVEHLDNTTTILKPSHRDKKICQT